jgi:hypothetical protein
MDEMYVFEVKYENRSVLYLEAGSMVEAAEIVDDAARDPFSNRIVSIRNIRLERILAAQKKNDKIAQSKNLGLRLVKRET